MKRFLDELGRRNVLRSALLYLVTAWLIVQVAETVLPLFEVPDAVLRGLVVVLAIGFLPAMFVSWAFELTPEGLVRDLEARSDGPTRVRSARRLDIATLIVATVAIAMLAVDWWGPAPGTASPDRSPAPSRAGSDSVPPDDVSSVAVLPFANLSADPENVYFAEGLSEEIMSLLARLPEIRVAGRSSSFRFRESSEDLRTIGEQLGVTHVVEGSVRRSEDRVRVTAQLVRTDNGFQLWSDTWDRDLDDIFAVQEEIGREVFSALRGRLLPESEAPLSTPSNPEAYSSYLKGLALLNRRGAEAMREAIGQFESALEVDADFAPAHAALARTHALLPLYETPGMAHLDRHVARALGAARRALELEPANASAWAAIGTTHAFHTWRWEDASEAFDEALALAPNDAEIVNLAGDLHRVTRDVERAVELEGRAVELDPLHAINHSDLAHAYQRAGRCGLAIESATSSRQLDPTLPYSHLVLVLCYGILGRDAEMLEARETAGRWLDDPTIRSMLLDVWIPLALDDEEAAREALETIERADPEAGISPPRIGYAWLLLGEPERARDWLQRAVDDRDWVLVASEPIDLERIAADPVTAPVLDDQRLQALMEIRSHSGNGSGTKFETRP